MVLKIVMYLSLLSTTTLWSFILFPYQTAFKCVVGILCIIIVADSVKYNYYGGKKAEEALKKAEAETKT